MTPVVGSSGDSSIAGRDCQDFFEGDAGKNPPAIPAPEPRQITNGRGGAPAAIGVPGVRGQFPALACQLGMHEFATRNAEQHPFRLHLGDLPRQHVGVLLEQAAL